MPLRIHKRKEKVPSLATLRLCVFASLRLCVEIWSNQCLSDF